VAVVGSSGTTSQTLPPQSSMFHQIMPPEPLALKHSGEVAKNWKLWKEKYNYYFIISKLNRESPEYQLVMFKHTVGDDALKVIEPFSYTAAKDLDDWHMVMDKLEKYCIGEVNTIYERYYFNK